MDGALLLKQGRFMKRYTGNPHVAVDINGKVWLNAGKLAAEVKAGKKVDSPKKKKPPVETGGVNDLHFDTEQNSEKLSTQQPDLQTEIDNLSPNQKKKNTVNKKEVQRRIQAMINSRYGCRELYFITISFPTCVTDAVGIKALNTWLTSLRKYRMVHQYLWVAERNSKGTIHFHMCVCSFFHVQKANAMMRGVLRNLHKSGEIFYPENKLYNGVDIAGRRYAPGQKSKKYVTNFVEKKGGKALGWYLTKYVTKNNAEFENLAWHNSRGFSCLFHAITLSYIEFEDKLSFVEKLNTQRVFENEWFAWAPWVGGPPEQIEKHLFEVNSYIQSLLGFIHPKDDGQLQYTTYEKKVTPSPYYTVIQSLKKTNEMANSQHGPMPDADTQVKNNERRMHEAFIRFYGAQAWGKWFSDKMRLLIIDRVNELGMQNEFSDLLLLIDKEHNEKDADGNELFFFTYHLYTYWAIDLLNQIPNN